jgi:hypothetical protein
MPHIRVPAGQRGGAGTRFTGQFASASSGGAVVTSATGYSFTVSIGQEARDVIWRSLRNTVRKKKAQLSGSLANLLALQLGEWRLRTEDIQRIVEQELWPNAVYDWLTGIGLFSPRRSFGRNEPPPVLTVAWNPQAKVQPTEAFRAIVEEGATFFNGLRTDK